MATMKKVSVITKITSMESRQGSFSGNQEYDNSMKNQRSERPRDQSTIMLRNTKSRSTRNPLGFLNWIHPGIRDIRVTRTLRKNEDTRYGQKV